MPGLLPVRFPGPLAEPAVRVSAQRALHGSCRQAGAAAQGLGIVLPRYRYRVTGMAATRRNSVRPAVIGSHRPSGAVSCRPALASSMPVKLAVISSAMACGTSSEVSRVSGASSSSASTG